MCKNTGGAQRSQLIVSLALQYTYELVLWIMIYYVRNGVMWFCSFRAGVRQLNMFE